MRTVRRVATWEDPYLTTHLYAILVVLTLVLLLIPWASVLLYGARLIGLALFGPHMHLVGNKLEANAAAKAETEARYQSGDAKTRRAMLAEAREELETDLRKRLDAAFRKRQKRTPQQKEADAFLEEHDYKLTIWPTRASGGLRFRSVPIPHRSRAYVEQ